jgi:hypothetical protein
MKHLIMTVCAAFLFACTALASEPQKANSEAKPVAPKEVVEKQKDAKKQERCIDVYFSCGGSGTACCNGCSVADLIIAGAIADPYICAGASVVVVIL